MLDNITQFDPSTLPWDQLALFAGAVVLFLIGFHFLGRALRRLAKKIESRNAPIAATVVRSLAKSSTMVGLVLGVNFGLSLLDFPARYASMAGTVSEILLITAIGYLLFELVDVLEEWLRSLSDSEVVQTTKTGLPVLVARTIRILVVVLVLFQIAQILSDKPLTSIVAGLGVGGLAVALAAQETIRNLFGSVVIFTDRPFEVGERIIVDTFDGVIEEVGFRSTRLRLLTGHLVTIPNGELANKSIENVTKRPHIRRLTTMTITYDTPPEKVQEAVQIIKDLLENHEGMHPDFPPKVFFNNLGSHTLDILVLYWYHPADYWKYMEFSERFNLEVFTRFGQAGIEFAFPTQTLYLAGDPNRPLPNMSGNPTDLRDVN